MRSGLTFYGCYLCGCAGAAYNSFSTRRKYLGAGPATASMLLRCTILLCLLSAAVTAQQLGSSDITSRTELASALVRGCGNDLACSDRLLDVHRDLVSKDLWQDVVSLGDA